MWFDIIGGILLITGAVAFGTVLSLNLKARPVELSSIIMMLNMFENEIRYMSSHLGEALTRTAEISAEKSSQFFLDAASIMLNDKTTAYDAWSRSIDVNMKNTSLNRQDIYVLKEFGKMLGNTDIEGQLQNIHYIKSRIEVQYKKAVEDCKRNEGLYRGLALMFGLAGVILLI